MPKLCLKLLEYDHALTDSTKTGCLLLLQLIRPTGEATKQDKILVFTGHCFFQHKSYQCIE